MFAELKKVRLLVPAILRRYSFNSVKKMSTNAAPAPCTDIVWMDMEMSGLIADKDKILEVACIITDKELNVRPDPICFAINHQPQVYEDMNEWCQKHHYASGLIDRCKNSTVKPEEAENIVLEYLKKHVPQGQCPLGGNSVHYDRSFLIKHMPAVNAYLHYRIIDVSTIKELAVRWNPDVIANAPKKVFAHRSLEDIQESIAELKYYKTNLFK